MDARFALLCLPLFLLGSLPAQAARRPVTQPPVMVTTDRYLFVLRGDVLYQYDVNSLELKHQVRLPAPQGGQAAAIAPRVSLPPARAQRDLLARAAIDDGLAWLKAHQDRDGRWDVDGFMKHDAAGARCDGPGNPVHDVGVTGLALLAFLGHGNTMRIGPDRDVVKRAVKWLREQQDPNTGLIGANAAHDFIYDHAIATLALSEAYGLSDYRLLRQNVRKGIGYLESHRNPYMVWRYQPRDNENDTSVTIWGLMAYASARGYDIHVNRQAMRLIGVWLDQVTDPLTGRAGYTKRGEPSSRHPGDHGKRFPPEHGQALTAAALFGRFLLGQAPRSHPVMAAAAETMGKRRPLWNPQAGTIDMLYWYFGTMAMYQTGGASWSAWSKSFAAAVLDKQRKDGSFAGSFDPVGVWGEDGGRVYSTALVVLALEVSHRFARLVK